LTKSFVVLIIGNSKSNHLGAQSTFTKSPFPPYTFSGKYPLIEFFKGNKAPPAKASPSALAQRLPQAETPAAERDPFSNEPAHLQIELPPASATTPLPSPSPLSSPRLPRSPLSSLSPLSPPSPPPPPPPPVGQQQQQQQSARKQRREVPRGSERLLRRRGSLVLGDEATPAAGPPATPAMIAPPPPVTESRFSGDSWTPTHPDSAGGTQEAPYVLNTRSGDTNTVFYS